MGRLPVYAVSLPDDQARLEEVLRQLDPAHFQFREAIGFPGRLLPDGVCIRLTRDPNSLVNKGALGCMLSHVRIWERIVTRNDTVALILEDDVSLRNAGRIARAALPDGFDFILMSDLTAADAPDENAELRFAALLDSIALVEQRRVSFSSAGYLVSVAGARRLLALFQEHFYFGHVDRRLAAYAVDLAGLAALGEGASITQELRTIRGYIKDSVTVAGYVCRQPVVVHIGLESRREREDLLGMTDPAMNPALPL